MASAFSSFSLLFPLKSEESDNKVSMGIRSEDELVGLGSHGNILPVLVRVVKDD